MDPNPQPGEQLTPEIFAHNLDRELESCQLEKKSFETLKGKFPKDELFRYLFHVVTTHHAFPRTTQADQLAPYGLNLKSFKTMLRQVQRFAEFMERVNRECMNEGAQWSGFHRTPQDLRVAIDRAKRWVRNPFQTLPKDMLRGLVCLVRQKTGRPKYRHVANLLGAAFAAAKVENPPSFTAEDIRKICEQETSSHGRDYRASK